MRVEPVMVYSLSSPGIKDVRLEVNPLGAPHVGRGEAKVEFENTDIESQKMTEGDIKNQAIYAAKLHEVGGHFNVSKLKEMALQSGMTQGVFVDMTL